MTTWLSRLFRLSNSLFRIAAAFLILAAAAAATAFYLAGTGTDLTAVRQLVLHAGQWMAGQHTDRMEIELQLDPDRAWLEGSATLTVRATPNPARRFSFLLNPGLELRAVRVTVDGLVVPAKVYRLLLLAVVELPEPIAANESARIIFDYAGSPELDPFGGESASFRADRILLGPETFWYPYDAQSFFDLSAKITLPSRLTLAHNGPRPSFIVRGATQEIRWSSERPLAGMALIAGHLRTSTHRDASMEYRVYSAPGVGLDARRIATSVSEAHDTFQEWFGESGYSQLSVVVDPEVYRAFNDGSGLMATPPRYFRDGDYGFHLLAHETAHVWWGGTVSERWLAPGTGGQWIVEGLATTAAALATEARYGAPGLARVRRDNFFDPDRQDVIQRMSFLDNALGIQTTRDTIYRKGGYVGLMLRDRLGQPVFTDALRQFVATHRYSQASESDVQGALETASGLDLSEFFGDWIRSDRLPDLALEPDRDGRLEVANRGRLPIEPEVEVVRVGADGTAETSLLKVGATLPALASGDYAVVDPNLEWADVWRTNNRFPPLRPPFFASAESADRVLVLRGSGRAWDPVAADLQDTEGAILQQWDLPRGVVSEPRWSPDGMSLVFAVARRDGGEPNVVTLRADGKRRIAGRGCDPAFDRDGTILAASGGRIVRVESEGRTRPVISRADWQIKNLSVSPSGRMVLYVAFHRSRQQVRIRNRDTGDDQLVVEGEREPIWAAWDRDESAVYAGVGIDAHWRVLRIPLGDASPTTVADGIASLRALVVSPGGTQLALLAADEASYPEARHVLHVLDLRTRAVLRLDIDGFDARSVTWVDADEIIVAARRVASESEPMVPADGALWRVWPASGRMSALDAG